LNGSLLSTRALAERVGLSPETILRYWRRGDIAGYRIGGVLRFSEADIADWLAERRQEATHPDRQQVTP
jgi:excisionase family DNA binding protein